MQIQSIPLLILTSMVLAGCGGGETPQPAVTAATASAEPAAATSSSAAPAASGAPSASASPAGAFVRHPPHSTNSDADAVDECTQEGGSYFSCRGAYFEEKDPAMKRYLWRIAQGYAAGETGYVHKGAPETDLPHAEVPFMCNPAKACGAKNEHGELNSATTCLARAHAQFVGNNAGAAKAAHAHACKCGPKEGSFPGYNRTRFICDEKGQPAFIAPTMKAEEAADIIDCAVCHPKRGPEACQREITRLEASDAELASHIKTKQIRRCQTANDGPNTWDQYQ